MKRLLSAGLFTLAFCCLTALTARADDAQPPVEPPQIASAAPTSGAASGAAHHGAKAPADEYFGRFKMSILGVRNVVGDIDLRAEGAAEDAAHAMCHKLILAEDALRDWQAKYPDDAWIPRLGYVMLKDYEKVDSAIVADDAHLAGAHAVDLAVWLEATYPNSEFAPR